MKPPPSPPAPGDLAAIRAGIDACAQDPRFRARALEWMRSRADNAFWHEHYLDGFFKRMERDAAQYPGGKSVATWVDVRFKTWVRALDATLTALHAFFSDDTTRGRIERLVLRRLDSGLQVEARACWGYIFELVMWRVCSYEPPRNLARWTVCSARGLVLEWIKKEMGGGSRVLAEHRLAPPLEGDDGREGFFAQFAAEDDVPGAALEDDENLKAFFAFLQDKLPWEKWRILDLVDLQRKSSLAVAQHLDYPVKTERIVRAIARLMIAGRFAVLAEIFEARGVEPEEGEKFSEFTARLTRRVAQSDLLTAKVQALAQREAVAPAVAIEAAARLLRGGRYVAAVEALRAARWQPRPGETAERLRDRLLVKRGRWGAADALLVELEELQIAERLRQDYLRVLKRCAELLDADADMREVVRAIFRRRAQRGLTALENFRADEPRRPAQGGDAPPPPGRARTARFHEDEDEEEDDEIQNRTA